MSRTSLSVTQRTETGKGANRRLRDAGKIPAVVYAKDKETVSVTTSPRDIVMHLNAPKGRNGLIELTVEGEDKSRLVLIRDYSVHPWRRTLEHVDFWEIQEDQELIIEVPIVGVKRAKVEGIGGRIRFVRNRIKVRVKPDAIPAQIEFDKTLIKDGVLEMKMSEIPFPEGIVPVYKQDFTMIQVIMPRVKVEEKTDEKGKKAKKAKA